MPRKKVLEQEWSDFIEGEKIDTHGRELKIEASEEQCANLCKRLKVNNIEGLKADLTVKRKPSSAVIHVMGRFQAIVNQTCVVSLEAFDTKIDEPLQGWFIDKESTVSFAEAKHEREVVKQQGEIEITDEKDDPESMVDGMIDLGELVVQHVSLALPPYPKKEGVSSEYTDESPPADDKSSLRTNPFEALKDWKEKR